MADNRVIHVGLVQMSMSRDADDNLKKAVARIGEARKKGADVVCLPELYRSPYFCQKEDARLFDLAEPVPGPSTEALGRAAREAGVVLAGPGSTTFAIGRVSSWIAQSLAICAPATVAPAATRAAAPKNRCMPVSLPADYVTPV